MPEVIPFERAIILQDLGATGLVTLERIDHGHHHENSDAYR
jgi:hypothetical protein